MKAYAKVYVERPRLSKRARCAYLMCGRLCSEKAMVRSDWLFLSSTERRAIVFLSQPIFVVFFSGYSPARLPEVRSHTMARRDKTTVAGAVDWEFSIEARVISIQTLSHFIDQLE